MSRERWLIATGNRHKVEEIGAILNAVDIDLVDPASVSPRPEPDEIGTTFAGNALIKAVAWAHEHARVAIADDSGLCVDALGGAPGVYSSRFAGGDATDEANNTLLLRELGGKDSRSAAFHCVIAVAQLADETRGLTTKDPTAIPRIDAVDEMPASGVRRWVEAGREYVVCTFEGRLAGEIAMAAAGLHGFGYDPIFSLPDGRRLAELTAEEKNSISHRSVALAALQSALASVVESA